AVAVEIGQCRLAPGIARQVVIAEVMLESRLGRLGRRHAEDKDQQHQAYRSVIHDYPFVMHETHLHNITAGHNRASNFDRL
ncbi:MAG: hypothetical protein ACYSR9_05715, partial [Planctomycetota bacterium]